MCVPEMQYRAPTFSLLLVSHGRISSVLCTGLPLFLFSLRHMVVFLHVMYRAPTFSLLLESHGRISSCYVQSSHFFSSPCVTWSYFFVLCTELPLFLFSLSRMVVFLRVMYRAPTFSLLLASHDWISSCAYPKCSTELPLFLFSLCHMVVFLCRVMYRAPTFSLLLVSHGRISSCYVQSSHFFSSPCVA